MDEKIQLRDKLEGLIKCIDKLPVYDEIAVMELKSIWKEFLSYEADLVDSSVTDSITFQNFVYEDDRRIEGFEMDMSDVQRANIYYKVKNEIKSPILSYIRQLTELIDEEEEGVKGNGGFKDEGEL